MSILKEKKELFESFVESVTGDEVSGSGKPARCIIASVHCTSKLSKNLTPTPQHQTGIYLLAFSVAVKKTLQCH